MQSEMQPHKLWGQRGEIGQQVTTDCCYFDRLIKPEEGFVSKISTREFTLLNISSYFCNMYVVTFLQPISIFTCWLNLPFRPCSYHEKDIDETKNTSTNFHYSPTVIVFTRWHDKNTHYYRLHIMAVHIINNLILLYKITSF